MPGKLHSKYGANALLASRNFQLMEFPAGNFDSHFSYYNDFVTLATDDTTGDPTEFTFSPVEAGSGNSTATIANAVGGILRLTSAANENDGGQLQSKGEVFKFADDKDLYYGVRVTMPPDPTQWDGTFGLCITTETITDGVSDGVYFRTVDGDAALDLVAEKNSTETTTEAITTLVASTAYTLEFKFQNEQIEGFVDGVSIGTVATNIPDDEELAISFAATNGETTAVNTDIDWVYITQLR